MERWATVKRIHQAALERSASQRAAFLAEACAGDDALRHEVESLLGYESAAQSFMESPALELTARNAGADRAAQLVGRTLSHYAVQSLLGVGGMGEVYLARDPRLDRSVALKILPADLAFNPDRLQRFTREARAASALNHPNVATIHDIGEHDSVRFIVMEYVEGQTIAEKIADRPLGVAEIVDVAIQMADALDAAHHKGITHRDIKPANLMVTPRGQVKVLDFGIAKTADSDSPAAAPEPASEAQTAVGAVIGSVPYMSPEQVSGRRVDHRSDLFSVGVTLYEMATARLPFAGTSPTETMDRILRDQPDPIARSNDAIGSELEQITFKCLEKDLERRYQSARDLLADLRNLKRRTDADLTRTTTDTADHHNLPAQLTSFVGREREIDEVRSLLERNRLLTLTGAGGCGKTRLALQVASEVVDRFRDGVWVVELSALSNPHLVTQSVASVLNVQEGPNRPLLDGLCDYVHSRQLLLVLDNCEHLIDACAQLAGRLLRTGADIHVLATSREALGIAGEIVWRVPSLSLPASSQPLSADAFARSEAVRLFVERAGAVDARFALADDNAATVAEVCRHLDGIPLAIELAAARLKVLSLDQVNERLNDRFRLLTGGSRTAVARQRTLEATVDWSYNLLSKAERRLLCRLSVFSGGWTLEAAEEICSGGAIKKTDMLDLLSHLVDKSLVSVDGEGERRYRVLETVRQYARERLLRTGEAGRVRDRHLLFFQELIRRAEPELIQSDQVSWLNQLQLDHDNLRASLEWCLAAPERANQGLELTAALFWFWTKRGFFGEGRQWLERALSGDSRRSPGLRAKALIGLWHMTFFQGDYARTLVVAEESLTLGREAGDQWAIAFSLFMLANLAVESGKNEQGARLGAECRAAAVASGDPWLHATSLLILGLCALWEGDYDETSRLLEEALNQSRQTGDRWIIVMQLANLAACRAVQQRPTEAKALAAEAIGFCRQLEDRRGAAWSLEGLAMAHAAEGQAVHAARLWGASESLLESWGSSLPGTFKRVREPDFQNSRKSLGDDAFQAAWSEGRAMSLREAIQYALTTAAG